MSEVSQQPSRFGEVSRAARQAKTAGLDTRDRREAVIETVSAKRLDQEPLDVQQRAIDRHFSVGMGQLPVVIDAVHTEFPRLGEVKRVLKERFPDITLDRWQSLYKKFLNAPRGIKLQNKLFQNQPDSLVIQAIAKVFDTFEDPTGYMVREAATQSGSNWIVAKRSRMWGDPNRRPFFDKPRGVKDPEGKLIQTAEYPTTTRAALYWAIRQAVEGTVGLNEEGKVRAPFLRLATHGAANREDGVDVVIGGGSAEPGKETQLGSKTVLQWFASRLVEKLPNLTVAIHRLGQDEAEVFRAGEQGDVEVGREKKSKPSLSGAGLGLEYFRDGHIFEVKDVNGRQRRLEFPGFGEGFQTVQLEVTRAIRDDNKTRYNFDMVLAEMTKEFPEKFPTLESLKSA